MKVHNCISSSADASMIEQICQDERADATWFLILFSTVRYYAPKKVLQFITLKEMWGYGLVVKRYLEYPDVSMGEIVDVFEEIQTYLQQKDFVAHFIDENMESDNINLLLNISLVDRKVTFRSWSLNGEMQESSLSYEEYGKTYMVSGSSRELVRFDIYCPVKQREKKAINRSVLLKKIKEGKISVSNRMRCLSNVKDNKISFKVMQEWFTVFKDVVSCLCNDELFELPLVIGEEERQLFETNMRYDDAGHLNQMVKVYNKLLRRLEKYMMRC